MKKKTKVEKNGISNNTSSIRASFKKAIEIWALYHVG